MAPPTPVLPKADKKADKNRSRKIAKNDRQAAAADGGSGNSSSDDSEVVPVPMNDSERVSPPIPNSSNDIRNTGLMTVVPLLRWRLVPRQLHRPRLFYIYISISLYLL